VTSCRLVEVHRCFGGTFSFHLQCRKVKAEKANSSFISYVYFSTLKIEPVYGVTPQKIVFFIVTAVRTSDITKFSIFLGMTNIFKKNLKPIFLNTLTFIEAYTFRSFRGGKCSYYGLLNSDTVKSCKRILTFPNEICLTQKSYINTYICYSSIVAVCTWFKQEKKKRKQYEISLYARHVNIFTSLRIIISIIIIIIIITALQPFVGLWPLFSYMILGDSTSHNPEGLHSLFTGIALPIHSR
jgi:hypothetical protein